MNPNAITLTHAQWVKIGEQFGEGLSVSIDRTNLEGVVAIQVFCEDPAVGDAGISAVVLVDRKGHTVTFNDDGLS